MFYLYIKEDMMVVVRLSPHHSPLFWKGGGTMFKWSLVCMGTKLVETTRNHSSCQNKGPPVLWVVTNRNTLPSNDLMNLYTRLLTITLECRLVVCTCGSWYINHTFDIEALQVALPFFNEWGHITPCYWRVPHQRKSPTNFPKGHYYVKYLSLSLPWILQRALWEL